MKKIILSVVVLAAAAFTTVKANTVNAKMHNVVIAAQQDTTKKTPVKLDELPAPIKTELQSDVFKTWVPTTAYVVNSGATQYYEVDVKKDADTKAVKFDKDGKIVQ
jgi:Skp family chaperone for outer membrane proteins